MEEPALSQTLGLYLWRNSFFYAFVLLLKRSQPNHFPSPPSIRK